MATVSFQPTVDDVIAANRAYVGWSMTRPAYRRKALIVGALMAVAGLAFAWVMTPTLLLPVAGAVMGAWAGLFGVIVALHWLAIPRRARRHFAQQKALHEPVTVDWSPTGIHLASGRGEGRFAWSDFHARHQGRGAVLLLQSEALYNFIPMRVLTPEQARELVEWR